MDITDMAKYSIEESPNNRCSCSNCKRKIVKGEIKLHYQENSYGRIYPFCKNFCIECIDKFHILEQNKYMIMKCIKDFKKIKKRIEGNKNARV